MDNRSMYTTKYVLSHNAESADKLGEHLKHNEVVKRERLRAARIKALTPKTAKKKGYF